MYYLYIIRDVAAKIAAASRHMYNSNEESERGSKYLV
jgi:hypothetical protein